MQAVMIEWTGSVRSTAGKSRVVAYAKVKTSQEVGK